MEKVRVLSYPPRHDYVDRLEPVADLVFGDEPFPELTQFYDPAWIRRHKDDYDVAHFHFTWEQYSVIEFSKVLDAHRANEKPIVWTAHDLRIPHTMSASDDEPYMKLLAKHADHVVTLTDGAAKELKERFGRDAEVIPHGPILTKGQIEKYRERYVRGLVERKNDDIILLFHAKHLRRNIDWRHSINAIMEAWQRGLPFKLRILVYQNIPQYKEISTFQSNVVDVVTIPRDFSLDALCDQMSSADVLFLPYRWGTHSGLVELAADIAMPVIATDVGYWDEQYSMCTFHMENGTTDSESLVHLLKSFIANCSPWPQTLGERMKLLEDFQSKHRKIYESLT